MRYSCVIGVSRSGQSVQKQVDYPGSAELAWRQTDVMQHDQFNPRALGSHIAVRRWEIAYAYYQAVVCELHEVSALRRVRP